MKSKLPSQEELRLLQTTLAAGVSKWELAQSSLRDAEKKLETAERRKAVVEEGATFFQGAAAALQEKIHGAFTTVGTQALAAVFKDPYELILRFSTKRGRTDAAILLTRNGMELDPMTAAGGGVVDLTAFALRLSALRISQPPVRQILVLDEPFRFVSAGYRIRVAELLRQLADEHGVQLLMVTHHPELQDIGKVIDVGELV